jgi:hypothetical protein
VHVERRRIGEPVASAPDVRYEGDTMIIPVLEEVLVVEKRLMLQEEIRVTRHRSAVRTPQRVTLRSEQARVERIEGEAEPYVPERADADRPVAAQPDAVLDDPSLIERKRRHTEVLRSRLASDRADER